jgi:hypothetical protein
LLHHLSKPLKEPSQHQRVGGLELELEMAQSQNNSGNLSAQY